MNIKNSRDIGVIFQVGKHVNGKVTWITEEDHNFITESGLEKIREDWFANMTNYVMLGTGETLAPNPVTISKNAGEAFVTLTNYTPSGNPPDGTKDGNYVLLTEDHQTIQLTGYNAGASGGGSYVFYATGSTAEFHGNGWIAEEYFEKLENPKLVSSNYDTGGDGIFNKKSLDPSNEMVTITNTRSVFFDPVTAPITFTEIGWTNTLDDSQIAPDLTIDGQSVVGDCDSGSYSTLFGRRNVTLTFQNGEAPYVKVTLVRKISCDPIDGISSTISGYNGTIKTACAVHNREFKEGYYSYINPLTGVTIPPTVENTILEGKFSRYTGLSLIVSNKTRDLEANNSNIYEVKDKATLVTTDVVKDMTRVTDTMYVTGSGNDLKSYSVANGNIVLLDTELSTGPDIEKILYFEPTGHTADNGVCLVLVSGNIIAYNIDHATGVFTLYPPAFNTVNYLATAGSPVAIDFDKIDEDNIVIISGTYDITKWNILSGAADTTSDLDPYTTSKPIGELSKVVSLGVNTYLVASDNSQTVMLLLEGGATFTYIDDNRLLSNTPTSAISSMVLLNSIDYEALNPGFVAVEDNGVVTLFQVTDTELLWKQTVVVSSGTTAIELHNVGFIEYPSGVIHNFNLTLDKLEKGTILSRLDAFCKLNTTTSVLFDSANTASPMRYVDHEYSTQISTNLASFHNAAKELSVVSKAVRFYKFTDTISAVMQDDGFVEFISWTEANLLSEPNNVAAIVNISGDNVSSNRFKVPGMDYTPETGATTVLDIAIVYETDNDTFKFVVATDTWRYLVSYDAGTIDILHSIDGTSQPWTTFCTIPGTDSFVVSRGYNNHATDQDSLTLEVYSTVNDTMDLEDTVGELEIEGTANVNVVRDDILLTIPRLAHDGTRLYAITNQLSIISCLCDAISFSTLDAPLHLCDNVSANVTNISSALLGDRLSVAYSELGYRSDNIDISSINWDDPIGTATIERGNTYGYRELINNGYELCMRDGNGRLIITDHEFGVRSDSYNLASSFAIKVIGVISDNVYVYAGKAVDKIFYHTARTLNSVEKSKVVGSIVFNNMDNFHTGMIIPIADNYVEAVSWAFVLNTPEPVADSILSNIVIENIWNRG
jgi:hypothetical protein